EPGGRGLGNGSRGNQRALLVARGLARGDENVTGPIRPLSTLVGRWKAVRHRELSPIQLTRAEAENNPIMTTATTPFWLVLSFTLATPLAATALVVLLGRAASRSRRSATRLRSGELFRLFGGRVAGRIGERDLRRAVSHADHEPFWNAMEAITTTLRPRERLALARSLARSAHLARERRVLAGSEPAARRELAARRVGLLPSARSRRVLRVALVRGPENVSLASARPLARHRDLKALRWPP